jgi:hypothetical protein
VAAKDQAAKSPAARPAREQATTDQAAQAAKEQAAKEQAAKEQAAKEQAAKEQAAKEAAARAAKEQAAKEAAARAAKEPAPSERVLQDQILYAVRTGQEATLHLAKTWVETFASVTPKFFDRFTPPKMDEYYGFAEKLWSRNCDFVVSLLEIASDFGKSVPEAGKASARRR